MRSAKAYTLLASRNQDAPGLLANDSDPDGDVITLGASGVPELVTPPQHGATSFPFAGGGFRYALDFGYVGTDSFTYRVCDTYRTCSTATAQIAANNRPTPKDDYYYGKGGIRAGLFYGTPGTPGYKPGLLDNDTDPEGDNLTVGNAGIYPIPSIVIPPRHGYITFPDNGTNGNFQYNPNAGYGGTDSFVYQSCDSNGACTNATAYLTVDPADQQNLGESCNVIGKPVNVTNGNMYLGQTDYNLSGIGANIRLQRTYNSLATQAGMFGLGWTTDYDQKITVGGNDSAVMVFGSGRGAYLASGGTLSFLPTTPQVFGQLTKNSDGTFLWAEKDGSSRKFDTGGKLLWQKDRNGNQTTLGYSGGKLTTVTEPFGRVLTLSYANGSNFVTQIADAFGTVANYTYNTDNTLQNVTYPDGSQSKFEYTTLTVNGVTRPFLTIVRDALNNILEKHDYDALGRAITSEVDGGQEKYTLDYTHIDDAAPSTTVTDGRQNVTTYWFDKSRGRNAVTKTNGVCSCGGGSSEVTQFFYDDKLNKIKIIDANNNETNYTYDANGNRLTMTDVLGISTYTYNNFSEILTAKDRMNGITTNTFNSTGNLLTTTDALGKVTTLTYNPRGQILTAKDARNNVTTLTYDTLGRLSTVKDADLKLTTLTYDTRSRLLTQKNALNYVTTLAYDLNNRISKVTFPDLKFVSYGYDLAGRRTTLTDENSNVTTYGYDRAYRLTGVTDALTHTTGYGYDAMSNRTSMTDALGNITNYEYDEFNRVKKIIYPPSTIGATRLEEKIEYDLVGNVKKRIDTANRETLYDYDSSNRLWKTTDADLKVTQFEYNARSQMMAVTDALTQRYDFTYDALGRQLSQTRAGATMSYEYDAVGNRTKRTDYLNQVTNYTYDNLNRLTNITYPDATENVTLVYDAISQLTKATKNSQDVTFIYDKRHRATSTTDVFGKVVAMTYDAAGNRTALKLDGVNAATYAYDVVNRLTKITNSSDAKAVNYTYDNDNRMTTETLPNGIASTYNYDGMSRLTRLKDAKGATTLFDRQMSYNGASQISQIAELTQTRNFGYDNEDRLTSVTGSVAESYVFDSVGNRTSSHLSASYSYQPNNRLSNTSSASYVHNSNGNMVSKTDTVGTTTYIWDYENRLKQVLLPTAQTVVYKYDALGRRIERNVNGTTWTRFTYDGLDVMLDQNSDGTSIGYLNGLGIDNKLRQTVNGQAQYFLNDHLGSTNALTDATGNVIASTKYDSFGNATNASFPTRYQFTGREFDSLTGLILAGKILFTATRQICFRRPDWLSWWRCQLVCLCRKQSV